MKRPDLEDPLFSREDDVLRLSFKEDLTTRAEADGEHLNAVRPIRWDADLGDRRGHQRRPEAVT